MAETLGPGRRGWLWYVPARVTQNDELPPAVAAALAAPVPPGESTVEAAAIPFHALTWGAAGAPPILMLHGVTSTAGTWWRMGPGLAAAGFRIVAPDLPGHGLTGHWAGHHRFRENAEDLVAFVRAAGLERPDLRIVGHSWGAMTAAAMPSAGLAPARLVLLDPPAVPLSAIAVMLEDPAERAYDNVAEAIAAIGPLNPTWSYGDVVAKAEGLTQFDEAAVRAVLTQNGNWDGGLASLADPQAQRTPVWLIRGDPTAGGYVPDAFLPAFEARIGAERIITIQGAPHSPQRTHPEALARALLRSLKD